LADDSLAGDVLEIMEQRHDWAKMTFTPEIFKHVFTELIPDVVTHSKNQDEEQVQDHYDRTSCHSLITILLLKHKGKWGRNCSGENVAYEGKSSYI